MGESWEHPGGGFHVNRGCCGEPFAHLPLLIYSSHLHYRVSIVQVYLRHYFTHCQTVLTPHFSLFLYFAVGLPLTLSLISPLFYFPASTCFSASLPLPLAIRTGSSCRLSTQHTCSLFSSIAWAARHPGPAQEKHTSWLGLLCSSMNRYWLGQGVLSWSNLDL